METNNENENEVEKRKIEHIHSVRFWVKIKSFGGQILFFFFEQRKVTNSFQSRDKARQTLLETPPRFIDTMMINNKNYNEDHHHHHRDYQRRYFSHHSFTNGEKINVGGGVCHH